MWQNWREMKQTQTNLTWLPERASKPLLGSDGGRLIFESMIAALRNKFAAPLAYLFCP